MDEKLHLGIGSFRKSSPGSKQSHPSSQPNQGKCKEPLSEALCTREGLSLMKRKSNRQNWKNRAGSVCKPNRCSRSLQKPEEILSPFHLYLIFVSFKACLAGASDLVKEASGLTKRFLPFFSFYGACFWNQSSNLSGVSKWIKSRKK